MTAENTLEQIRFRRGGCLDTVVTLLTIGKFGLETSIDDNINEDEVDGVVYFSSILDSKITVVISKSSESKIIRKIVKNR